MVVKSKHCEGRRQTDYQTLKPQPLSIATVLEYFEYLEQMLHIHKHQDTNTCAIFRSGSPAEAGTGLVLPSSELVLLPQHVWDPRLPHLSGYLAPREGCALPSRGLNPTLAARGCFCEEVMSLSISLIH